MTKERISSGSGTPRNEPLGSSAPSIACDPFSPQILHDPYAFHEEMREAGAAVQLSHYGIWGLARFDAVRAALTDWKTFSSARGVGIQDFAKEKPWRPPSVLIETDPPLHTRTRSVLTEILSPATLSGLRVTIEQKAEALVDTLLERGCFNAVADLAVAFPLDVIPDAIGLQEEGRENLLPFSEMVFNSFGPDNEIFRESLARSDVVVDWVMKQGTRRALSDGGFGARVYEAAHSGKISEEEASILVRAFVSAGLDTTINGLAAAIYAFALHPAQWNVLASEPKLVSRAFDEVIRWESPIQTFFRTTTQATLVDETTIPAGEKVMLFLGAANRDPRRWEAPSKFDIRRKTSGHLAFGFGIHACVGQMLARLEAEYLLGALVKRVRVIELTEPPKRRLNNTLRAFASLPVSVQPR